MSDAAETVTITVERDMPFPPEKVWRALTQPHLMEEWLMKNDFALSVGHRFQLRGDWGGVLDCEVLEIDPLRTLAYSWNFDNPTLGTQTVVTFTLEATASGTRLRVEQAGFHPDRPQNFNGARFGWQKFLGNLEQTLGKLD